MHVGKTASIEFINSGEGRCQFLIFGIKEWPDFLKEFRIGNLGKLTICISVFCFPVDIFFYSWLLYRLFIRNVYPTENFFADLLWDGTVINSDKIEDVLTETSRVIMVALLIEVKYIGLLEEEQPCCILRNCYMM